MSIPPLDNKSRPSRRDYVKLWLGITMFAGFLALLAFKHPTDYGMIPSCPFHTATGFYCPGCGSMRAAHYLLNGHLTTSLRYNPLVLLILPLLVFSAVRLLCWMFLRKEIPFPGQTGVYWVALIVFLVFFIVRNIPLESFAGLRPPGR
ncbi:MAG: DUF2752 domain-containing protein [Planctomycetaceae bacterium]|nr:DUF2752 domain-containing protein [Planctomycetaceae bacterium]